MAGIGPLELKQRITHIAGILDRYLPGDFEQSIEMIRAALPPRLDPNLSDGGFGDFIFAPFCEIIVRGDSTPGPLSMAAIKEDPRFVQEPSMPASATTFTLHPASIGSRFK